MHQTITLSPLCGRSIDISILKWDFFVFVNICLLISRPFLNTEFVIKINLRKLFYFGKRSKQPPPFPVCSPHCPLAICKSTFCLWGSFTEKKNKKKKQKLSIKRPFDSCGQSRSFIIYIQSISLTFSSTTPSICHTLCHFLNIPCNSDMRAFVPAVSSTQNALYTPIIHLFNNPSLQDSVKFYTLQDFCNP